MNVTQRKIKSGRYLVALLLSSAFWSIGIYLFLLHPSAERVFTKALEQNDSIAQKGLLEIRPNHVSIGIGDTIFKDESLRNITSKDHHTIALPRISLSNMSSVLERISRLSPKKLILQKNPIFWSNLSDNRFGSINQQYKLWDFRHDKRTLLGTLRIFIEYTQKITTPISKTEDKRLDHYEDLLFETRTPEHQRMIESLLKVGASNILWVDSTPNSIRKTNEEFFAKFDRILLPGQLVNPSDLESVLSGRNPIHVN